MRIPYLFVTTVVAALLGPSYGGADEVRFFEQDGVTYRETRRVVQRPTCETRMQTVDQTVYRQEKVSELRDTTRTWWAKVTEYQCEARLVGRWNPLVQPHFENRLVPRTRWEQRCEVVRVPVTCCRLVPEARTVQMPVATRRMVNEEVISRVAVGRTPSPVSPGHLAPIPNPPAAQRVGGLARLDNDPPRRGVSTAWRPSSPVR